MNANICHYKHEYLFYKKQFSGEQTQHGMFVKAVRLSRKD